MSEYEWLEKKVARVVDNLKLWPDNPRLDPEGSRVTIHDYALDLVEDSGEKESFLKLINSIATNGYIPADPVVVWKNEENDKFYVAEGNRRVLALKLLRSPNKAPKVIRGIVRQKANMIPKDEIEKIKVCVAPSFEQCEWYINQRHFGTGLQKRWSRLQQQKWTSDLYYRYEGNIDKVESITGLSKRELEHNLRIISAHDLAIDPRVLSGLSIREQESVKSHRLPMSIIERWFFNSLVQEKWKIQFEGSDVKIDSNESSFFKAFTKWIQFVLNKEPILPGVSINTRTITTHLAEILNALPEVTGQASPEEGLDPSPKNENGTDTQDPNGKNENNEQEKNGQNGNSTDAGETQKQKKVLARDHNRGRLVVQSYELNTNNFKLLSLFNEFKNIPVHRYSVCVATSLRVFLDMAISEYTTVNNFKEDMCKECRQASFRNILLSKRLEYLKKNKLLPKTSGGKVIDRLLNSSNEYSLDTLNNYIHSSEAYHVEKNFLVKFWDFLFPLFDEILEIEEV